MNMIEREYSNPPEGFIRYSFLKTLDEAHSAALSCLLTQDRAGKPYWLEIARILALHNGTVTTGALNALLSQQ